MKIYTTQEVADILQLSRRTIYTYLKEGKIEALKVGKYFRITDEALKKFIDDSMQDQRKKGSVT